MITKVNTTKQRCPRCGTTLDTASCPADDGRVPQPGDLTICAKCETIMVFNDKGFLRNPTDKELEEINAEYVEDLKQCLAVLQADKRTGGRRFPVD